MNAKTYLNQLRGLDSKIVRTQEQIERLRSQAQRCTTSFDGVGGGSSQIQDKMAEIIAKYTDKQNEFIEKIGTFQELQYHIIDEINEMPFPYSDLLYKRYVEYKMFEQVAYEMRYSYNWTIELHGKALKEFANKYLKNR